MKDTQAKSSTAIQQNKAQKITNQLNEKILILAKGIIAFVATVSIAVAANTGIVTYKKMQTTAPNDAVTIIATDVVGNTTQQTAAVSVKTSVAKGFIMNGENAGDWSGFSVSSAGDVNGDGLDDLIVGAYFAKSAAGKSFVVFGKANGAIVNLSAIVLGTGGFVINGEDSGSHSGHSVSSAGDVNGDGLDDLIVGAYQAVPGGKNKAGESYVVFGKADGTAVNLSTIVSGAGTGGFVINGESAEDWSGFSVSSAGDVNGDGLGDLIVGAYQAAPGGKNKAGKSYVVFGKTNGTAVNLSAVASGTGGFVMNGESAGDWSGFSVSSAGDVNGDGLGDLIIGAYFATPDDRAGQSGQAGKTYVVFGKADGTAVNLSTIASSHTETGFIINGDKAGDRSGFSVSSAGDVNGDGLDDLILGTYFADPDGKKISQAFVVFGTADGNAVILSTPIISGPGGFVINGDKAGDRSGASVSSAGDVNGDGLDDLIVGAYYDGGSQTGKSFVVFGKTDDDVVNLSAMALNTGTGGFVINGANSGDWSGASVSSAGDVNGDGLDDLIVGAYLANPADGKGLAGESFVIFGKTDTKAVDLADIRAGKGVIAHAVDFQGDTKDNTLTGTSADELFVAGSGNDVLTGNGGTDVFNAGKGNDTIVVNADNLAKLSSKVLGSLLLARVNGGGNTDTLKLAGTGLNLDLTQIANGRIQDIEIIDLTGSGNNTLTLNLNDLLDVSSVTNVLKVVGNSGDKVKATGFSKSGTKHADGKTYDVYGNTKAPTAKLWIEQGLTVI
ncbi:beta strand repeat-containing protein [Bathymodiolus thermophilus thioautotrophic gill symbiont]|uniref:beta strand repeat-containing protein n=1 Tax=Bathymodiolus thermophilus thioautotrophic gill symbiont TaxID=2360 RepID=UPI0011166A20|nr:FG-GAP-like repeat-containing protein [Bathymodiolus thermophilus thioautotrophic gill symbiont]